MVVRSGWAESGRLGNTLQCAGWPHHGITGPCNKTARPGAQRLRLMPRTVALETLPTSSALTSSAVCFSPLEHQLHQSHPELTAPHSRRAFARALTTLARSSSHHRCPCSFPATARLVDCCEPRPPHPHPHCPPGNIQGFPQ